MIRRESVYELILDGIVYALIVEACSVNDKILFAAAVIGVLLIGLDNSKTSRARSSLPGDPGEPRAREPRPYAALQALACLVGLALIFYVFFINDAVMAAMNNTSTDLEHGVININDTVINSNNTPISFNNTNISFNKLFNSVLEAGP